MGSNPTVPTKIMDANKRKVLFDIEYQIQRTCENCMFSKLNGDWGICTLHDYKHLKHTDETRHLSIHRTGQCYSYDEETSIDLGGFNEFKPR